MRATKRLPQQKTIKGLKSKVKYLLAKTKELKGEAKEKEEEAQLSMWKANKSIEVIKKIQDYIGHPNDINKARLFDSNLAKASPIVRAKIMDYAFKMEKILKDMRSLFFGLELEAIY